MTKEKFSLLLGLALTACLVFSSCNSDENINSTPIQDEVILAKVKELLTKEEFIVLRARAMMGPEDKTRLPEGCPLKYYFSWNTAAGKADRPLNIKLIKFTVGSMPLTVDFNIHCKFIPLNKWERDEYKGDGWIKFVGEKGDVGYIPNEKDEKGIYTDGEGGLGTVVGYLNVDTKEIEFSTNFNVMLMQSFVYRQKIDYSKKLTYEQDFKQYEEDLAKYKKEHGIL